MEWIFYVGALLLSALSFMLGRYINESQVILAEKRSVYRNFLKACPRPNDAYQETSEIQSRIEGEMPMILMYASANVVLSISEYVQSFDKVALILDENSPALTDKIKTLAKQHNDIILEMRRDTFAWSVFGYSGKSRLPKDALDRARELTEG